MSTKTLVADHKSAIIDLAKTVGMQVVHDDGDDYIVLGDDTFAEAYAAFGLDKAITGVVVEVEFNDHGEVSEAHKEVDGVNKGDVPGGRPGNAGQRLLWTLHLFSRR